MFPIYNIGGRTLGFTGRVLSSEKTKAKYVNSPESDIYSKGKVLFGLHLAKNEIVKFILGQLFDFIFKNGNVFIRFFCENFL